MTTQDAALSLAKGFTDLIGAELETSGRTLADVADVYLNTEGVDPTTPMYNVSATHLGDPTQVGTLAVGISRLHPVSVNGELNMTRGHVHVDRRQGEIYVGVQGEGLLLLRTAAGEHVVERVVPGSVHQIPGDSGHRLVNTGADDLHVFAVWPTVAGHDYAAMEELGFGLRVFRDGVDGYRVVEDAK